MSSTLGKLYIVATPIGNMSDMTFRAVETLKNVDVILCEDTRTTGGLLKHYGISNKTTSNESSGELDLKKETGKSKLMSFHSHSKLQKVSHIIELIREGKNIALVSDAGTPCISDPGVMLIAELQKAFPASVQEISQKKKSVLEIKNVSVSDEEKLIISPIPGASALISALSIAGIPVHEFTFKGFVPHKKGRETFFTEISETAHTVVFYESVHRIMKTLESLNEKIPNRKLSVARELTKIFEEQVQGTPEEVLAYFLNHPDKVRGEFVVIVGPKK